MTLAELLSILAAAGTLYGLWNQRRYMAAQAAVTFSQADSNNVKDALTLKAEYKADLKDLRAELEVEHTARKNAEGKLEAALEEIEDLKEMNRKSADDMAELKEQVAADKITRDEIVKALTEKVSTLQSELQVERDSHIELEDKLKVTTERLKQVERDNLDLSLRLTTVEKERIKEQAEWKAQRTEWREKIWLVIKQVTDLGEVPKWRPPDTQPLGKLAGE